MANAVAYCRNCGVTMGTGGGPCKGGMGRPHDFVKGSRKSSPLRETYEQRVMEAADRATKGGVMSNREARFYGMVKMIAREADINEATLVQLVNDRAEKSAIFIKTQRWQDVDVELRNSLESGHVDRALFRLRQLSRRRRAR